MRYLIVAALVLGCSLCLAQDFPQDTNEIKSLTTEQAADLVMVVKYARENTGLNLDGLTAIGKDGAQELPLLDALSLAKLAAQGSSFLGLNGLTSIDKYVAQELAKFEGSLLLNGLTSMDKDVAQELAKFEGSLWLNGLTSIDKDVAQELAKCKGNHLSLRGLNSIDKDVAASCIELLAGRLHCLTWSASSQCNKPDQISHNWWQVITGGINVFLRNWLSTL